MVILYIYLINYFHICFIPKGFFVEYSGFPQLSLLSFSHVASSGVTVIVQSIYNPVKFHFHENP